MRLGIRQCGIQLFRSRSRTDRQQHRHSRRPSAPQHRLAILRELFRINMRVRIDQFNQAFQLPSPVGAALRRLFAFCSGRLLQLALLPPRRSERELLENRFPLYLLQSLRNPTIG